MMEDKYSSLLEWWKTNTVLLGWWKTNTVSIQSVAFKNIENILGSIFYSPTLKSNCSVLFRFDVFV